jgi:hypothetical protein
MAPKYTESSGRTTNGSQIDRWDSYALKLVLQHVPVGIVAGASQLIVNPSVSVGVTNEQSLVRLLLAS